MIHYHATIVTTRRTTAGQFLGYDVEERIFRDRAAAVRAIQHSGGKDCPYCVQECQNTGCELPPEEP